MKVRILTGPGRARRSDMTDITDFVLEESFDISHTLYSQVDTLNIRVLEDPSVTFYLNQGDDIIVEDYDRESNRLFGGIIQNLVITSSGINQLYNIRAVDWTYILGKTTIRKGYVIAGQTDQEVIRSAVTGDKPSEAGLTEFNVNQVRKGRVIPLQQFNGSTLRNVLDTVCDITGFIWFVDPFKNIIYKDRALDRTDAAFTISPNNLTTFPMQNLRVTKTLGGVNSVEIKGGGGWSPDVEDIYSGDGTATHFVLGSQLGTHKLLHPPAGYEDGSIRVFVNTGSNGSPVWDEQLVKNPGVVGVGSLIGDVHFNRSGGPSLTFQTAPPNFANSFRVIGKFDMEGITLNEDRSAIAKHGREYKLLINAGTARSAEHAWEMSQGVLRENTDRLMLSFTTNYDRPSVGTMSSITHPNLNLDNEKFLIRSVSTSIVGGEVAAHAVEGEIIDKGLYLDDRPSDHVVFKSSL